MVKIIRSALFLCLLLLLVINPAVSFGQDTDANSNTLSLAANGISDEVVVVTIDQVNQLKKDFTAQANVSPEDLARFEAGYNQVIKDLEQIKELEAQRTNYIQMQKNAPADKEQLEKQIADAKKEIPAEKVSEELTISEAESKLAQVQLDFNNAKQISAKFENEPQRRAKRTTEIPEAISKATESLSSLTSLKPPVDITAQNGLAYIDFLKNQVKIQLNRVQIETLQEEMKAYEAAKTVLPLRRELAAKILAANEKKVENWQGVVNQIRKRNLQQVKQEAQSTAQQAKYSNDAAKEVAQEIGRLTETQAGLLKKIESVTKELNQISSLKTQTEGDFTKTKELIGKTEKVTSTMGMLLQTKKDNLPEIKQYSKNIKLRFDLISSAQLEWHTTDAKWTELLNIEARAEEMLARVDITKNDSEYGRYLDELKQYLEQERQLLSMISGDYINYLSSLAQLDAEERDLIDIVQEYSMLIEKNLLWIKSRSSFEKNQIKHTLSALKALFDKKIYVRDFNSYVTDFKINSVSYYMTLLVIIILSASRFWFRSRINSYTEKIKQAATDRFLYTVNTTFLSTIAALPVPLLLAFLAWRYSVSIVASSSGSELYSGLQNITTITLMFFLLRWFTIPGGLCTHLKFDKKSQVAFRKHLLWFYVCVIVLTFLYSTLESLPLHLDIKNAGLRSIFLVEQIFVTAFLFIVFNPNGSIVGNMQEMNSSVRIHKLIRVWFILVIIVPFIFCIISMVGYINAARLLHYHLAKSLLFFLAVLFVNRLILRWLYVSRRRLVLKKYLQQKQENQEKADSVEVKFDEIHDSILNLSKQSRQIINVATTFVVLLGFWWIWKSTLPALEAIEQIKLGSTEDGLGGVNVITLGSTFKAVIIIILTIFTSKNIPGLMEIFILQKLEIASGTRFAFTTMVKYIITIAGVIYACAALGLRWQTVQWLIAAVSVGLGFGLQEIFANFISGLIILFEQPVRVGDYVTIGDVSGQVSQIKIRATTIVKWDRKELLVPNKEFITGRLINWTLSDEVLRIDFNVGVAYGSDIKRVEETLFKIARSCKKVSQEDPKPKVIFTGFGDSTLDFELRVYISDIDDYLKVWHKINCDIDAEFRKNNIEIAFPQRDLHLRSSDIKFPVTVSQENAPVIVQEGKKSEAKPEDKNSEIITDSNRSEIGAEDISPAGE